MLSIVTIAHGRRPQLRAMMQAAAEMRPRPFEVVVVDLGGDPIEVPPGVPVNVVPYPADVEALPLAAARNAGASAARGTMLLFLDADCIPSRDLAGEMRAALGRRGGLVMANVRYLPDGFEDDGGESTRRDASAPHPVQDGLDDGVPPELFWSTAFGVRRRVFTGLGGFCEDYVGYGGEDTDLGFTAAARGVPISRWRTALAYHQWHPSPDPPLQHVASIVRNAQLFHRRWGRWPMTGWLGAFAEMGLVTWEPDAGAIELVDRVGVR